MVSREQRAFWIALPTTSFVSSCSFIVIGLVASRDPLGIADLGEFPRLIGSYTLFMIPFVAAAGLVFGLPVIAALRRIHLTSLPMLLAAGAAAGSLFSALILWGALAMDKTFTMLIWASSIGIVPGLTAAAIWWLVAERKHARLPYV